MSELLLYASTFVTVFALGFQSLNVNQGRYAAAFLTSFAIGGSSLVLYRYLPEATWTQVIAYLLGGATGIVASMWMHKRTVGRTSRMGVIGNRPITGYQPERSTGAVNAPVRKP